MRRPKLIAGNWKMYKTIEESKAFLRALYEKRDALQGYNLVVFTQAALLPGIRYEWEVLSGSPSAPWFSWGPQSIYWEEQGAFTGEFSPFLAKQLGSEFALAGHSERRQLFGETNESAAKRALAAHKFGMQAVFCVGEQLTDRDMGQTFDVIRQQCAPLFASASSAPEGFTFAYEPVWAIGTGRTAKSEQAQEVHAFLRDEIASAWGKEAALATRILYGGSVKPENAKELMGKADVDGVLIGGASLDPSSFLAIAAAGDQ